MRCDKDMIRDRWLWNHDMDIIGTPETLAVAWSGAKVVGRQTATDHTDRIEAVGR